MESNISETAERSLNKLNMHMRRSAVKKHQQNKHKIKNRDISRSPRAAWGWQQRPVKGRSITIHPAIPKLGAHKIRVQVVYLNACVLPQRLIPLLHAAAEHSVFWEKPSPAFHCIVQTLSSSESMLVCSTTSYLFSWLHDCLFPKGVGQL